MSPVRHDPLTGEPVLLAPGRASRPHDSREQPRAQGCPFCEGSEDQTPPETLAVRPAGGPPDAPGWLVRAFPNKFPALAPEEGVHEVVVSTPRHVIAFADLDEEEAARAAAAWWARLRAVAEDPRALWPFVFLNQGAAAGASLQHSHAQVVGLPFAPPRLVARERAFDEAAACPVCVDLAAAGPRCVAESNGLAAWYPEVPPLSGVVRIAPVVHAPDWADEEVAASAGRLLRDLVGRISRAFGAEAINVWLHERRPGGGDRFHWHLDAVPRMGTFAGLELGAGVVAVLQAPEAAAERLRAAGDPER